MAVELDGSPWRTLPAEAVLRAGLAVGGKLDRTRAVTLARERRRLQALGAAGAALALRELTRSELDGRLERQGVAPADRAATLAIVAGAGLQDDARAARLRATGTATRCYGDAAIRADLDGRGVSAAVAADAIAALEPESERAERLVARYGLGVRAAQALARRGFAEEIVARAVADLPDCE